MSKAFTKEDEAEAPPHLPSRAPLPSGVPNYVTASGRAKLVQELADLQDELAKTSELPASESRRRALTVLAHRRVALEERVASARLVTADEQRGDEVRFGAWVTLRAPDAAGDPAEGTRRYRIVGVDEADAALGLVAFSSPLGKALLGRGVGETAVVRTPRGSEEWEIAALSWEE